LSDFISIIIGRRLLTIIERETSALAMLLCLLATLILPTLFCIAPVAFGYYDIKVSYANLPHGFFLIALGLSNAFGALAALLFFIISATVLLHRLFWPVLRRPVMAAHRHGLLQQRKLLGGAGVALLGHASPVGQWLEQSLKSVHISFGG